MTLTTRQADLLRFIEAYRRAHGVAPSYSEMAAGIDAKSRATIHRLLQGLASRGAIRRWEYRARAIEVLCPSEPARSALEAVQDALAPFPMRERVDALVRELERLTGRERAA